MQLEDQRFEVIKSQIPWASIALAIGLMLFGITSFIVAWMHFTQEILGKEQAVGREQRSAQIRKRFNVVPLQEFGFTFLGLITFIPGWWLLSLIAASKRYAFPEHC